MAPSNPAMLVAAIDTSGKSGGISLAEGDGQSFRIIESSAIAGGTFSAQLVPTLAALLHKHGLAPLDLDGFSAISGPGSFTGLRVGLSAIKGLAEVLKKPIATVSLLEALADVSGAQGAIGAALDAGREEIFFGLYERQVDAIEQRSERLLSRKELIDEIRLAHPMALVSSDGGVLSILRDAGLEALETKRPGSEEAARIGLRKLLRGETVSVETLDANYLRRSDAEIHFNSTGSKPTEFKPTGVKPTERG